MIEKMWINVLASEEYEKPLMSTEELKDVTNLMIDYKIDLQKFSGNLCLLLTGGMPSIFDVLNAEKRLPTTKSMHNFISIADRPSSMPLWLLAGFPDVLKWLYDMQKELLDPCVSEEDGAKKIAMLFGIDIRANEIPSEKDIFNEEKQYRVKYYRNLIDNYKKKTCKGLELKVKEGSSSDIYSGVDFLKMIGEKSNFTLIASMTTKYYLELKKNFTHSFANETSLLSIAGILDAQAYIFGNQQIKPAQIIDLARKTENSKERLLDFILHLEVLLLSAETPELSFEEVRDVCENQKSSIEEAIERTLNSYTGDLKVAKDANFFMKSNKFAQIRKSAGAC